MFLYLYQHTRSNLRKTTMSVKCCKMLDSIFNSVTRMLPKKRHIPMTGRKALCYVRRLRLSTDDLTIWQSLFRPPGLRSLAPQREFAGPGIKI